MELRTSYVLSTTAQAGNRWFARFCLLAATALLIPAVQNIAAAPLVTFCVAAMFFAIRAILRERAPIKGAVTVGPNKIWFDRATLDRADVINGYWSPGTGRRDSGVVLIGTDEREIAWVATPDREAGQRLLDYLGVGPDKRVVQFDAVSVTLLPATIHVGADGVLVGTSADARFVPWTAVKAVSKAPRGAVLELTTGEPVELRLAVRSVRSETLRLAQAGLVSVARAALAAALASDTPAMSVQIARNGRVHEEWVSGLLRPAESFREAPLRAEDLWRVVESASAEPTARAGAAAVLAQTADVEEKARLRIAADTCAEPKLRIALDLAASGADPLEALGSVEGLDEREVHGRR